MANESGLLSVAEAAEVALTPESETTEAAPEQDTQPEVVEEEPASAEADDVSDEAESEEPTEESDEADDDDGDDDGSDEPDVFDLTDDEVYRVDGEEISGAELKQRMLMQQDYTVKTQELAEQRKQVTETVSALETERKSVLELMPTVVNHEKALQSVFQMGKQLQEALPTMSPEQQKIAQPMLQMLGQAASTAQQSIKAMGENLDKAKATQTAESLRQLKIRNKGWGPEVYAKVKNHAVESMSFAGEQIDALTDWRIIQALNDSMELQAIKAKAKTQPKAKDPAPVKTRRRKGSVSGSKRKVQEAAKRAASAHGIHAQLDSFADLLVTEAQSKRR